MAIYKCGVIVEGTIILVLSAVVCGKGEMSDSLRLAHDGQSDYCVVIAKGAEQPVPAAAEEFVHFFEQITGVRLPIVTDDQPMTKYEIIIGPSKHLDNLALYIDWDKLGKEGYVIRTFGNCTGGQYLLLFGGPTRGTINAVYTFLEDDLGCRWYTPTFSVIPKKPNLMLDLIHVEKVPAFEARKFFFYTSDPAKPIDIAWAARIRLNYFSYDHVSYNDSDKAKELLSDPRVAKSWLPACKNWSGRPIRIHTLESGHLLPISYFEEHPEYFGMTAEGKRDPKITLCLTNPKVLPIVVENAKAWLKHTPGANIISISQSDQGDTASNYCHCAGCRQAGMKFSYEVTRNPLRYFPYVIEGKLPDWADESLIRPAWDPGGKEFGSSYVGPTGVLLEFVNKVAVALHDEYPDVLVHTLAYCWSQYTPQQFKLHPNVIVDIAPLGMCTYHPLADCVHGEQFHAEWTKLQQWRKLTPHVWVFRYDSGREIRATLRYLDLYFRELEMAGVHGVYVANYYDQRTWAWMRELRQYLYAKLLWKPSFDVKEGTEEFIRAYYGPAADEILTYVLETQQPGSYDLDDQARGKDWRGFYREFHSYGTDKLKKDAIKRWDNLFTAAERKVADEPTFLERVKTAHLAVLWSAIEILPADDPFRIKAYEDYFSALKRAGMHDDSIELLKKELGR